MKFLFLIFIGASITACYTTTHTNLDGQTRTYVNDPVFGNSEKCVNKDGSSCPTTSKYDSEFEKPTWSQRGDDTRPPIKALSK